MCMCVTAVCTYERLWITRFALHHYFYYNCHASSKCNTYTQNAFVTCAMFFYASWTMRHYLSQQIGRLRRNYSAAINSLNPFGAHLRAEFYDPLCFSREFRVFWFESCVQCHRFEKWRILLQNKTSVHRFLWLLNYYPRARSKSPRFVKRLRARALRSEF